MRQLEILYASFIITICFFIEYWAVKVNDSIVFIYSIIIICMVLKITYMVTQSFKSIIGIVRKGTAYHIYLIYIAINAILLVSSFASDYFTLQLALPESFEGVETIKNEFEIFFKMFYLSLLLFTNLGVADIGPRNTLSEILVMCEGIVAFVSLIFMLSDYTTLRETFSKSKRNIKFEEEYEEKLNEDN